jgi:subtilase family serine protease
MKTALLCATILGATATICAAPARAALPKLPEAVPLITGAIDEASLATLAGDHPHAVSRATDLGKLDEAHVLPHVIIGLKRPPALQAAFDRLTREQTQKGSPNYRNWITAGDLRQFGPAEADIARVTAWLQSHGLTVNKVSPSGMTIDVAGRVGDFNAAFHTEVHSITLDGHAHIANLKDPAIPAALTPVVHGLTLNNVFPRPAYARAFNIPATGNFGAFQAVVPADFATIYNLNPLLTGNNAYGTPYTGAGATIAVVEQTNIHAVDWNYFVKYFGLSGYKGSFVSTHPGFCGNPGYTGDEVEAAIDAEWAIAAAPSATIIEASCAGSETSFGVETTLQNLVELGNSPATIYSISYEDPEAGAGATFLSTWNNLVQEGASEGVSVLVASGDNGTSNVRNGVDNEGLFVNGLASTPYDLAVGGTDFYDTALGKVSTYWAKANAKAGFGSAKSYIPEIPWNNSCASSIIAGALGYSSLLASCNASPLNPAEQQGVGGSGGASTVYAKPDWQLATVPGVPADGARDVPDVALFAANGVWNHFYLICMSDANEGGAPCKYTGTTDGVPNALFSAYGGTSVATPAFAGILALVSQANDNRRLGNPAPRLYQLANAQYNAPLTLTQCNATLGNHISSICTFNNITAGNIAEPCVAKSPDCYAPPALAPNGLGITSAAPQSKPAPVAYPAQPGFSLATGLGSVNATNLLYNY